MEEILVNINYLIREKLWGSIRVLAEKVSKHIKRQLKNANLISRS